MIMVTNNDAAQLLVGPKCHNIRQEKFRHLKYLNEFRTQQCLLFLEQQCQFHRPYTCFHWHFPNQKRRRPFKRSDGTFNYNPDVYCDKYDETSGSCIDGDDCPYAHRNAGDTERRYHPRYFKTGNCIYETTDSGACVKNGLHCAFAHGPDDIRLPVYDIREVQDASSKFTVNLPASLEKERVLSEDPKWNEMFHVLACYKTESCKKPPRMCRQGYSCPFYHNGKDKRRAPDKWRYRSTPCPVVRPGDEWQDSNLCEAGDACVYCHTRTEQQFHPEIYKSTKCNDVINSGYCPRGPFCAFAHCDSELTTGRDFLSKLQHERLSIGPHNLLVDSVGTTLARSNLTSGTTLTMGPSQHTTLSTECTSSFAPAPVLPNLMSPIGGVASPPGGSTLGLVGRGRRVGRCASPHQSIGIWHSPSSCANMIFAPNAPSPSSGPDALSNVNQHPLQMGLYQYRHQGARVTGRHRSGSSISSETGIPSFTVHDLTPPSRFSGAVNTFTYPGRGGTYGLANTTETLRLPSPFIHPTQHPLLRSTPRKHSDVSPQTVTMSGPVGSLMNTQYLGLSQQSPRGHLTSSETENLGCNRSATVVTAPLLRGDIWSSNHPTPMSDSNVDPFLSTSWAWKLHTDSGHNSETSATETDVPGSLLDTSITHPTSMLGGSNRDSGLALDFFVPCSTNPSDRLDTNFAHSNHYLATSTHEFVRPIRRAQCTSTTIAENSDDQWINEFLPDALSKTSLDANHLPPDLFADLQTFYNRFMNSRSAADLQRTNSTDVGFQSPLDDILLHTTQSDCVSGERNVGILSSSHLLLNTCSSPLAHSTASDPMTIPGCNYDTDDMERNQYSNGFVPFVTASTQLLISTDEINTQRQQHAVVNNVSRTQNTWPLNFIGDRGSNSDILPSVATNFSSTATTRFSHSFSPVVGTPIFRAERETPFEVASDSETMEKQLPINETVIDSANSQDLNQVKLNIHNASSSPIAMDSSSVCTDSTEHANNAPRGSAHMYLKDLPQSPIFMSSPFSNPMSELECLSLQRELDEIRQRLGSKENEVENLKKQRDFVTEHLRDSLGVIRQLFTSLNVSTKDLSKPLFVDTTGTSSSAPSTGPLMLEDDLDDRDTQELSISTPPNTCGTHTDLSHHHQLLRKSLFRPTVTSTSLQQQQQEALASLFSNPLVIALLNSSTTSADSCASFVSASTMSSFGVDVSTRATTTSSPGSLLHRLHDQSALPPSTCATIGSTLDDVSSSNLTHHDKEDTNFSMEP